MRIWHFLSALPTLAIGLACCRLARDETLYVVAPFLYIFAFWCFVNSALILWHRPASVHPRDWFVIRKREPRVLHPSEDTTQMFD